jgi:type I restriction enzyme, S subunit
MKASWVNTTVANSLVRVLTDGRTKIQTREYKPTGLFPVIDQGQDQIAGWTNEASAVISAPLPLVLFGDHTRAFKYVEMPFARGADGTQLLRPRPEIDPKFFFYACRALDLPARGYNRHFTLLKEKEISYPAAIQEQKAIAGALWHVESTIRQQEALLVTLRDLKRATMPHLFTRGLHGEKQKETAIGLVPESWNVLTVREVRHWLQYGTSTHCKLDPARFPVLRIPNVEASRINVEELKYCDLSEEEGKKYLLHDGDVLFIRTNGVLARLGSCAVYEGSPARVLFASYLIRARLKRDLVEPRFASYFFGCELGTSLVAARATPAADGKYNLNTGTIDSFPIPLPASLDEQREIVNILDTLDRKIALHQQKRTVLEELFNSLLHKLMTGEIRVDQLDLSALQEVQHKQGAPA